MPETVDGDVGLGVGVGRARWVRRCQRRIAEVSKLKPSRQAPEEVDAYLADLPADFRGALERVRAIIRETVPACTERVSS